MLKISRLADYASSIMRYLAYFGEEPVSAVQIAESTRIAAPTVRKVLKQLSAAGVVCAARGKVGGYMIAKASDDITLANIVEAIDGPIALTECNIPDYECEHMKHCHMKKDWQIINATVRESLDKLTLASLCRGGL